MPIACLLSAFALGVPIFDGTTLDGFEFIGPRDIWSVEDGAIVGRTTDLAQQAWLYWPGEAADFSLTLEFMINVGNSGINYRSRPGGPLGMSGYQADLDGAHIWTGALYDVGGRGLMTPRGARRRFGFQDNRQDLGSVGDADALVADISPGTWHTYEIVARGPQLVHRIDGRMVSQTWDEDPDHADHNGGIAFQLHPGERMDVAFRNIDLMHFPPSDPGDGLIVPDGFTAEKVFQAGPDDGSWVSMVFEPGGALLVSPQFGRIRRIDFAADTVELLEIDVGSAQGMLHAHGALYLIVSRDPPEGGLHRLRDTDADGRYDADEHLAAWGNGSEHGPHAVVLGPDDHLWIAQGNHTPLPPRLSQAGPFRRWAEDILLERQWDANGHAVGIRAPGGVILRTDLDATEFEIISGGLRNACDLAFTPDGECFTWDSDMEWDMGTPWYRPPRVVHVIPGAENGWRSGTEKFPDWYPDTLPPVMDTPPASPTGMVHAGDGAFGADFQGVLLVADWSYGRIWSVRLVPHGASWRGELDVFARGRPFNVSDMVFGPDGALYAVTGGRGTASAVWRIALDQPDATRSQVSIPPDVARRRSFERAAHLDIDHVWAHLGSGDPALSTAARMALDATPATAVRERAASETDPAVLVDVFIHLARVGSPADCDWAVERLGEAIEWTDDMGTRADLLRVIALTISRQGPLSQEVRDHLRRLLSPLLDSTKRAVQRSAADLLVSMDDPRMPNWLLERMESDPVEDGLYWAKLARLCTAGWTDASRLHVLRWLRRHRELVGGHSIGGFVRAFEERFLRDVPQAQRGALLARLDVAKSPPAPRRDRPFVQHWTMNTLPAALDGVEPGLTIGGATIYGEARCLECHRFGGLGGTSGPDLTGIGGRFSREDLLRAIVEPSHDITDQYAGTLVETTDGLLTAGRLLDRDDERIVLDVDPYAVVELVSIQLDDVVAEEPSEVSLMPVGLLDRFNAAEIQAMLEWLIAGAR